MEIFDKILMSAVSHVDYYYYYYFLLYKVSSRLSRRKTIEVLTVSTVFNIIVLEDKGSSHFQVLQDAILK